MSPSPATARPGCSKTLVLLPNLERETQMVFKDMAKLATGFEGAEKSLKVDFAGARADLRTRITRRQWDTILAAARCEIISVKSNTHCDAYLLSESSLFVYPTQVLLKTCGTTPLLACMPHLCHAATQGDEPLVPVAVSFSRCNFMFPDAQPAPHRSFSQEVEFLEQRFKGSAHILGPINGPRWHVFRTDTPGRPRRARVLEVVMFELDPAVMELFYQRAYPEADALDSLKLGQRATRRAGIDTLMPGATVDAYLFEPCGYSLNALRGPDYFTIHITPEPECCFVSVETNAIPTTSYRDYVDEIVALFRPKTVKVAVHSAPTDPTTRVKQWELGGYVSNTVTQSSFQGVTVACGLFTQVPSAMAGSSSSSSSSSASGSTTPTSSMSSVLTPSEGPSRAASPMPQPHHTLAALNLAWSQAKDPITALREVDREQTIMAIDVPRAIKAVARWRAWFPHVNVVVRTAQVGLGLAAVLATRGCSVSVESVSDVDNLVAAGVNKEAMMAHVLDKASRAVPLVWIEEVSDLPHVEARAVPMLRVACEPTCWTGASPAEVPRVLAQATARGIVVGGLSLCVADGPMHVPRWERALAMARHVYGLARTRGSPMTVLDLGDVGDVATWAPEVRAMVDRFRAEFDVRVVAAPNVFGDCFWLATRVMRVRGGSETWRRDFPADGSGRRVVLVHPSAAAPLVSLASCRRETRVRCLDAVDRGAGRMAEVAVYGSGVRILGEARIPSVTRGEWIVVGVPYCAGVRAVHVI